MDQELGRLIEAFEAGNAGGESKIIVVGDHGEGLGDHGEVLHGNLLYSSVMRVPLVVAGSGIPAGEVETAVSTRRVFDTILGWAGLETDFNLLAPAEEIVMGEALKPFLQYGWQPQVMAVRGSIKVIQAGGDRGLRSARRSGRGRGSERGSRDRPGDRRRLPQLRSRAVDRPAGPRRLPRQRGQGAARRLGIRRVGEPGPAAGRRPQAQ